MLRRIDEAQTKGAGDVRAQEEQDEKTPVVIWEAVIEVDTAKDADDDEDTVGNLHQGRAEGGEAEA
jgi:hypothetical protein